MPSGLRLGAAGGGRGPGLALPPLLRRPAWRRGWDTAVLALPLAGPLATRLALSRFARSLAAQYASGIPLVDALPAASR